MARRPQLHHINPAPSAQAPAHHLLITRKTGLTGPRQVLKTQRGLLGPQSDSHSSRCPISCVTGSEFQVNFCYEMQTIKAITSNFHLIYQLPKTNVSTPETPQRGEARVLTATAPTARPRVNGASSLSR